MLGGRARSMSRVVSVGKMRQWKSRVLGGRVSSRMFELERNVSAVVRHDGQTDVDIESRDDGRHR